MVKDRAPTSTWTRANCSYDYLYMHRSETKGQMKKTTMQGSREASIVQRAITNPHCWLHQTCYVLQHRVKGQQSVSTHTPFKKKQLFCSVVLGERLLDCHRAQRQRELMCSQSRYGFYLDPHYWNLKHYLLFDIWAIDCKGTRSDETLLYSTLSREDSTFSFSSPVFFDRSRESMARSTSPSVCTFSACRTLAASGKSHTNKHIKVGILICHSIISFLFIATQTLRGPIISFIFA